MSEKLRRLSRREAWRAMGKPDSGQRLADAWAREEQAKTRPQRLRQAEQELAAMREVGRRPQ